MKTEKKAYKDWFDRNAADALAEQVSRVSPAFDSSKFVRLAMRNLPQLEFSNRVKQFSAALAASLPGSIPQALRTLERSLPESLPDCEAVTDGWLQWPIGQFIADYATPHPDAAFATMIELTKRFSSEFAVRPFVAAQPDEICARLLALTTDPDPHVRRWCSEGVRPRLPWGRKLHALVADPAPIWPILEALKNDPELYVRRSVANNLNDIAKDHPGLVVERCRAWSKGSHPARDWLIKHGLRTLIKDGNPGALAIVGFHSPEDLGVVLGISPKKIALGESVTLKAELSNRSKRTQKLMVDYAVHYVRGAGKTSTKVFKWTTVELAAGESASLEKRHAMKRTTTRSLYPGAHRIEVQVNGARLAESAFRFDG